MADNFIDMRVDEKEFVEAMESMVRMHDSITPKWIKSTYRRKLKPMKNAMQASARSIAGSSRIADMISITTAKKRAGDLGAKVGVVRNDPNRFPNFSAQALASVLEYGTGERFRKLKAGVFITGRQSTGSVNPHPFLRPAWDAHVGSFMSDMEDAVEKKVMKEAG